MPESTLQVRAARQLTLWSLLALVALISMKIAAISDLEPVSKAVLWCIAALPLLVFMPGLMRGAWKTYLWVCFVLLLYFSVVVTHLFMPGANVLNWLQLIMILLAFVAAMMFARWRQQEINASKTPEP